MNPIDMADLSNIYADHTKPYRDANLEDRNGELWKPVPGLESNIHVSNHGRIKRLERTSFNELGIKYITPEKIIIPAINHNYNKIHKDYTYRFQVGFQIDNVKQSFQVQRLVYYCFVEEFDLKDKSVFISSRQENGLDIRPEYLKKYTAKEKLKEDFESGRRVSPLLYDKNIVKKAVAASVALTSKMVSSYNEHGKLDRTYTSISDAARAMKVTFANVKYAIERPYKLMLGFYWRLGSEPETTIMVRPERDLRELRGTRITKCDLNGTPICAYLAVSEAALLNKISHKAIMLHIKNNTAQCGGFIWRLGIHV